MGSSLPAGISPMTDDQRTDLEAISRLAGEAIAKLDAGADVEDVADEVTEMQSRLRHLRSTLGASLVRDEAMAAMIANAHEVAVQIHTEIGDIPEATIRKLRSELFGMLP